MKKFRILQVLTVMVFTAALLVAGCQKKESAEEKGGAPAQKEETQKTANLVYVNWAEGVAYTHLAKLVLEDKMGYEVTITAADVGPAYTAVAQGDRDAFMETWLPTLHKDYIERFKDDVVDLGHVYEDTQSGWVVPTYVTIDKISQMNEYKDKFGGKITGIDSGAGIMKTSEEVIEKYGLDYKLLASSGPAMTAALQDAIKNKEWIVVTGWRPHWMFSRWDLKFLEQDEDKMVWSKGNIHIMARKNLEQDKPELAQFLKNMFFTDKQLASLMLAVKESEDDTMTAVRQWMNQNEEVVSAWIPER